MKKQLKIGGLPPHFRRTPRGVITSRAPSPVFAGGLPILRTAVLTDFLHYLLENYTREPPITQEGGITRKIIIETPLCEGHVFFEFVCFRSNVSNIGRGRRVLDVRDVARSKTGDAL